MDKTPMTDYNGVRNVKLPECVPGMKDAADRDENLAHFRRRVLEGESK